MFLLLLSLATIYPVPSCRYKTYAQESTSTDENAGIMLAATSGTAFTSLEGLARDLSGKNASSWKYYQLGIVDLEDPGAYDCRLFAFGFLHSVESNGSVTSQGGYLSSCVVVRLANGNWASTSGIGTANIASGNWPVYFRVSSGSFQGATFYGVSNIGAIDYDAASSFMANFRDFVVASQNLPITDSVVTSLYDDARLNSFETYDSDGGGVSDLAEWVRRGDVSDWKDDVPSSDPGCKCGACCSCECVCGQWSGDKCGGTANDCDCHKPPCTCANYCCACACECERCADGEHATHKNDAGECDGTFENCPDCHEEENPEEECTCANYCCKHTCECKKCADGTHSAHKNDNGECDGTFENCSDCHEEENPEEETCTCASYCCYHTCACPVHKDKEASEHSQHGNGATSCDGTTDSGGCSCHETTGDEEECTCASYCCYHTCECKRCASLPAASHSQHKNNSPTCNGTTDSGGCSCHTTTDDNEEEFDEPEQPDFEELTPEEREEFLSGDSESDPNSFSGSWKRLRDALDEKFKIDAITAWFDGDFSGKLPSFDVPLPNGMGSITIDFETFKEYSDILKLRLALAFGVNCFFVSAIIRDVKKFL